jgi:hypothetical protein
VKYLIALSLLLAPTLASAANLGGAATWSTAPPPAPMTTPVFSLGGMLGSGTAIEYGGVQGSQQSYTFSTVATARRVPIPIAGVLSNLNTSAGYAQAVGITVTDNLKPWRRHCIIRRSAR